MGKPHTEGYALDIGRRAFIPNTFKRTMGALHSRLKADLLLVDLMEEDDCRASAGGQEEGGTGAGSAAIVRQGSSPQEDVAAQIRELDCDVERLAVLVMELTDRMESWFQVGGLVSHAQ